MVGEETWDALQYPILQLGTHPFHQIIQWCKENWQQNLADNFQFSAKEKKKPKSMYDEQIFELHPMVKLKNHNPKEKAHYKGNLGIVTTIFAPKGNYLKVCLRVGRGREGRVGG